MASKKCLNCVWCVDHFEFIYCPFPYCMRSFDFKNLDQQDIIDDKETEE